MSEMDPQAPAQGDELMALARERSFEELEAAWMRRLESGEVALEEMLHVADYLVRRKQSEQAALLLWSLVADVAAKRPHEEALRIAIRAAGIVPEAETLREEIAGLYRKLHPDIRELDAFLETSGIRTAPNVSGAIHLIQQCLRMRAGTYVIHTRSRRVGRVEGFEDGAFLIHSEGNTHKLAPNLALANWEPAEQDDFRALVAFEPERLRDMAREDPIRLVHIVLRLASGPMEFKQFKFLLIPAVIPATGWSAWWNAAKVALKRDPQIKMGAGTQPTLELRAEATSYSDKIRDGFEAADTPYAKVKQVLIYLAELDAGHEGDPELGASLGESLQRFGRQCADPVPALALLSAAHALHKRFPHAPDVAGDLSQCVKNIPDTAAMLKAIDGEEVARLVLDTLKEVQPEQWPSTYAEAFPGASLRLCDWIARELARVEKPDLLHSAAERTTALPETYPEAFAWVWRWALTSEQAPSERLDRVSLTVGMLDLINRLGRVPRHSERREELKAALSKLRALISASDYRLMREVIAASSKRDAHLLHEVIRNNDGLADDAREALREALRDAHAEEFIEKKNLWEDGMIYTSPAGLAKRQAEMDKLANEDIPRNAIAIGKAASLGDLRENWEYKSALEERDRLVERATRCRADLDRARIIDPAAITGEIVNVGTDVTLRETTSSAEKKISFVGPWEADIPQGIYSYLAPLSQRFMGKRVGDRVKASFDDVEGEYEIVKIEVVA